MNRKHKNNQQGHSTSPRLTKGRAKLGGTGQSKKADRAAQSSSAPVKRAHILECWKGVGQQVNDNTGHYYTKRPKLTGVAAFVLMAGMLFGMNGSAIATQAVMHTDDAVLSAVMDVSPAALGFVLNKVNIGE